jgi:hypothetical protein
VAPEPARLPYFLFQYRQMEDDMIAISTAQFGLRVLLAIGMGAMVAHLPRHPSAAKIRNLIRI